MALPRTLRFVAIVSVFTACAVLELGTTQARSQTIVVPAYETIYVPTTRAQIRYERRAVRAALRAPLVVVPRTYVTNAPTVVTETRYVESAPVVSNPVVETRYVESTIPTVTRRYVPAAPSFVETRYLQAAPIYEQRVITYPY